MSSKTENASEMNRRSEINSIREKEHKILIIDDKDKFRKAFRFKLEKMYKAEVTDVNSGEMGVEELKNGAQYDFIFTDMMMPGINGIETYHELRKIDPQTKIVIMSAYPDSDGWKQVSELKDVTLLHKPISDDDLIKVLCNYEKE